MPQRKYNVTITSYTIRTHTPKKTLAFLRRRRRRCLPMSYDRVTSLRSCVCVCATGGGGGGKVMDGSVNDDVSLSLRRQQQQHLTDILFVHSR